MNNNVESIYGFDLLKFIMAIMIVAIHSANAFINCSWGYIVYPFIAIGVPCFFVLSSFFLFKKLRICGISEFWGRIGCFIKRICTFYLFWFVINLPFIVNEHRGDWLGVGLLDGILNFGRDLFFYSTFTGSWFLAALVLSVLFVALLNFFRINEVIIACIGIGVFVYFGMNSFLPESWHGVYLWTDRHLQDVYFTFITGIPYVIIGFLLSNPMFERRLNRWKNAKTIFSLILIFMTIWLIIIVKQELAMPLRIPFVVSTLLLFYVIPFSPKNIYRTLRNYSILMYMVHFDVIKVLAFFHVLPIGESFVTWFFVTLFQTLLVVSLILQLQNYKYFHWLKYAS